MSGLWARVEVPKPRPSARELHSAVLIGEHLYVFGGTRGKAVYADLWRMDLHDTRALAWSLVPSDDTLPAPSPRWGHSAVEWGGAMWVFGGMTEQGETSKELWSYHPQRVESPWVLHRNYSFPWYRRAVMDRGLQLQVVDEHTPLPR